MSLGKQYRYELPLKVDARTSWRHYPIFHTPEGIQLSSVWWTMEPYLEWMQFCAGKQQYETELKIQESSVQIPQPTSSVPS